MIDLDLLTDEDYEKLSFSQLQLIRRNRLQLFLELLENEKISEKQILYWRKYSKILEADVDLLLRVLNNSTNNDLFHEEPLIVQNLIQELTDDKLTNIIRKRLSIILQSFNKQLLELTPEQRLKMVELIHTQKCSVEDAYQKISNLSIDLETKIHIQLTSKDQQLTTILTPLYLLIRSSDYFKIMFQSNFKESIVLSSAPLSSAEKSNRNNSESVLDKDKLQSTVIHLPDIDPESFNILLDYLATGNIDFESIDLITFLTIVSKYQFNDLQKKLEIYLCQSMSNLSKKYSERFLLELAQDFSLKLFAKLLDLKIASSWLNQENQEYLFDFYSEDFLNNLELVEEFALKNSCLALGNIIEKTKCEDRFLTRLIKIMKIKEILFDIIFEYLTDFFEQEPKILQKIYEEADKLNLFEVRKKIYSFLKNPNHIHISLAIWDIYPKWRAKLQSIEIED